MTDEQLDRAIAETVMGIRCVSKKMDMKDTSGRHPTGYQLQYPDGRKTSYMTGFFGWGWHKGREAAWECCPKYSTDIACAWMVWEKLGEQYQVFRAFVGALHRQDSGGDLVNVLMGLSPKIICTTALLVVRKAKIA